MINPSLPVASLLPRIAAMVYDSLLVISIAMVYGAVFLAIKHAVLQIEMQPGQRASIGNAGFMGMLLLIEGFFWFFWCRGGQTLGMRTWRLQLRSADGGEVTWSQALIRGLTAPLSLAALGLGYLWCLWDRDGATWHDKLSGTKVVRLPKAAKH